MSISAASSPIIIENSAGRLDLVPSMKLEGTLAEPALLGSLDMVDEGRLTLLGRSFRLTEARVVFADAGGPTVRLIGETRVGDYAVTLRTQGPVTDLEATYTSDPPLSQRDVQSLLVTGRTTDTTNTKSSENEQFVLGTASSDLLGLAGQMVGLESVQLGKGDFELGSSDVNPAMRLTVTKSISARTRLILSQDLDNNKLTWIVVLVPKRGYEIRLSQRDNVEEVLEFRQELSFGPGVSPPSTSGFRKRTKGPRVQSLEFTGDLGYPVSELESVVKLKPPKEFDAGVWQQDRARLEAFYSDRGYATARIVPDRTVVKDASAGRVLMTYRVDRGPRTVVNVRGIDVSEDDRRQLMRVWSRSVLPEFLQEDMTLRLRELLAERGYLRPSITVALDAPDSQVVTANVVVEPGPVTTVRTLAIEGAHAVAEPELRAALSGNAAVEHAWVDPAPLVDAVVAIYAARGYPSARVSADELVIDGSTAERRLRVAEGPQAVVKDVVLTGVAGGESVRRQVRDRAARGPAAPPRHRSRGQRAAAALLPRQRVPRRRRPVHRRRRTLKAVSQSAFAVTEGPVSIVNAVSREGARCHETVCRGPRHHAEARRTGRPAGHRPRRRNSSMGSASSGVPTSASNRRRRRGGGRRGIGARQHDGDARRGAPLPASLRRAGVERVRAGVRGLHVGRRRGRATSAIATSWAVRSRLGASGRFEKNLQSARGQFSLPVLFNQRLQTNYFITFRSETDTSDQSVTYTDKERDITFEQRWRLPHQMEASWGYSYNVRDVVDQRRGPHR